MSLPTAFLTMALVLLHTFWGIIFFDACERRRAGGLGLVVGSHLLTSGLVSPGGHRNPHPPPPHSLPGLWGELHPQASPASWGCERFGGTQLIRV